MVANEERKGALEEASVLPHIRLDSSSSLLYRASKESARQESQYEWDTGVLFKYNKTKVGVSNEECYLTNDRRIEKGCSGML